MQEIQIARSTTKTFSTERVAYLVCGFISKTISRNEAIELQQWVSQDDAHQLLFAELILPYNIKSVLGSV